MENNSKPMLCGVSAPRCFSPQPGQRPTIRFHLVCLVLACVAPVWVIAGLLAYNAYDSKRTLETRRMLETARALSMSVDRELNIAWAALQTLSTSPVFASGDLASIHRQARDLVRFYPDADIIVADAGGQQLVNSYRAFGAPLPKRNTPETVRRIFRDGKPIVSDLYFGAVTKRPMIAIDVPVFRNGRVVYDLSMTLPFYRLGAILSQQRLPSEWYGAILDSRGVVVTSTRDPKRFVGKMAVPGTRRAIASSDEGVVEVTNLEGIRVFDAFCRSRTSNWTVVIGVPASVAMKSMYAWLAWSIGCALLLSLFGIALATRIGNGIARSIQSLVSPAMAIGSGEPAPALAAHSVRETERVAKALVQTSRLLEKRAADRDRAESSLKELNETLEKRVFERTAALSASDRRLRLFFEHAPAGLAMFDRDMRYLYASRRWRNDYQLGDRDLTGVSHYEVFPEIGEEWQEAHRRGLAGEVLGAEGERFEREDGSIQLIRWEIRPWTDTAGDIGGIVIFSEDITERKRAEEAIEASLREKEVLLKEIHHRVKNNMQVISSLVSLQSAGSEDRAVIEVLKDVSYRVRSMALVHEKLYQSADLARIDFAEYIRSLLSYLWRAHGELAATIQLNFDLNPVLLPVDTAVPCGLILNELAGNALKHAFKGREKGKVTVSLHADEHERINLCVRDDGIGLPEGLDWRHAKSLGLRLVQMLARQLDAEVEVSGSGGMIFTLSFRLKTEGNN